MEVKRRNKPHKTTLSGAPADWNRLYRLMAIEEETSISRMVWKVLRDNERNPQQFPPLLKRALIGIQQAQDHRDLSETVEFLINFYQLHKSKEYAKR